MSCTVDRSTSSRPDGNQVVCVITTDIEARLHQPSSARESDNDVSPLRRVSLHVSQLMDCVSLLCVISLSPRSIPVISFVDLPRNRSFEI
ncbi:hypothetical protein J6590_025975 [Homalodisca vitripennis]|nr:hypothetical protein J6590_025975 [Homalodisca vitripennis]